MNDLFRQLRNERRANLWLGVELLVVFAVMWYLVDWTYVTVRTWLQPMGFDTEHCYNLSFNRLTPQAEGYRAEDDAEADMRHLLEIFLGVIGTFWFRTQHRRSEIALRMAFGSTRRGVFGRLVNEGLLLLTLAAVPAALVAFNVGMAELVDVERMPFDAVRFVVAIGVTWVLMSVMVVLGIWYPARRAMRVQPAEALHDE